MEQVNTAFKTTRGDLQSVQQGIASTAQDEVAALNTAIGALASANDGLRRAIDGSPAQAQQLDARDQALLDITKRIDANVTFDGKGIANVTFQGQPVVDNITPYQFCGLDQHRRHAQPVAQQHRGRRHRRAARSAAWTRARRRRRPGSISSTRWPPNM